MSRLSVNMNLGIDPMAMGMGGIEMIAPQPRQSIMASPLRRQSTAIRQPSSMSLGSVTREREPETTSANTTSPQFPLGIALGSTIQNAHTHHYHYHLYQTTVNEAVKDEKEEEDDKEEEEADADLQELLELFPDGIPDELLMDDGSGIPQEIVDEDGNVITVIKPRQKAMKNIFGIHDLSHKEIESLTFFANIYRFLHDPSSSFKARVWSVLMVIAIITSSVMILLQSMPSLTILSSIDTITTYVEFYSVVLFSVDYLLKLFSVHSYADCILPKPLPYNVLWKFFIQPLNFLDFVSVVPFWIQYVLGAGATSGNAISLIFRIIRMFRIIRLLKVAQYSRSIDVFFRVIIQAWDALLLLLFFVGFGCITFGTLVYITEKGDPITDPVTNTTTYWRDNAYGTGREISPFTSIPLSFWFIVTTLTTVGYGDMVPTTFWGRIAGAATMLSGVVFISTPLIIFGTHFQNEFTKEIERVAFVQRRQEKIKRKQLEKERKAAAKEREEKAKREKEAAAAFGGVVDLDDPMAAAMGLAGGGATNLPGQVPAGGSDYLAGEEGEDTMGTGPKINRPFAAGAARRSMMTRGSTFGGSRMSVVGGDVAIRVGESNMTSARGGAGGPLANSALLPNMSMVGANGCVCPCMCGARNLAGSQIPGEDIIGGVRRSTFAKSGAKMSIVGSPIVTNPTAADQLAMKKGMDLANAVLPDRITAEKSAAAMAASAGSTLYGNLSAANVLEMQQQLESLKQAVNQLGGLLMVGGAPAPAVAKAMMDSVAPVSAEAAAKQARKSIKLINKAKAAAGESPIVGPAIPEEQSEGSAAAGVSTATPPRGSPVIAAATPTVMPEALGSPTRGSRSSVSQPSSGKLTKTPKTGPVAAPEKTPSPDPKDKPKRPSLAVSSTPVVAGTPIVSGQPARGSLSKAPKSPSTPSAADKKTTDFALPPPAYTDTSVKNTESTPLLGSQISSDAVPMSPVSAAGISFDGGLNSPGPVASPTPPPESTPTPPAPTGPVPLSVDQIIPAKPKHVFPAAPADETTIACTTRLLESMIDNPKLSDKLLEKPPFRFIHDVVTNMVTKRGFPESYFDASELDPANLSSIQSKLEFLEKLLDLISIINQTDLSHIDPRMIIQGREHENTNQLLQEFAKAAASGITVQQITEMMEAQESQLPPEALEAELQQITQQQEAALAANAESLAIAEEVAPASPSNNVQAVSGDGSASSEGAVTEPVAPVEPAAPADPSVSPGAEPAAASSPPL